MKLEHFVGIDVSKETFTYCLLDQTQQLQEGEIENSDQGVLEFICTIRHLIGTRFEEVVFCMEHTGIYCMILMRHLHSSGARVSVENAYRIKSSLGLTRGKSDKLDARRIAEFAMRFEDRLSYWQPKRKSIKSLQLLEKLRKRLLKAYNQILVPLKEANGFIEEQDLELISKSSHEILGLIESKIKMIEDQIQQIISRDHKLNKIVKQVQSIPGIGPVTAIELLIRTNEFKDFQNAKKLACHVGIAPFEHSSGSSIRGRTRVSHKAHKSLKTLLTLGAMATLCGNNEFRVYYDRKLAEGKNKLSIIICIRNKILHRAFAVVKNDTMYDKNYQYSFG